MWWCEHPDDLCQTWPVGERTIRTATDDIDFATMEAVQRRILWLATRMIDHANHDRASDEIKVGGHQASSASMVSIMTALWFGHLSGEDKVAVKPHSSPVYHAIKYLTGELDASYLTRLRQFGGLQVYPSRTKDPDVADFSTGSVGLGVVAPLFAAAARRFVESHFGPSDRVGSRFIALAGDAELDEGGHARSLARPCGARQGGGGRAGRRPTRPPASDLDAAQVLTAPGVRPLCDAVDVGMGRRSALGSPRGGRHSYPGCARGGPRAR